MGRAGAAGASGVVGSVGAVVWTGAVGGWSSAHPGDVLGAATGCDVAARGVVEGVKGCQWGWKRFGMVGDLPGAVQRRDVAVLAVRAVSWVLLVVRCSDVAVVGVAVWW